MTRHLFAILLAPALTLAAPVPKSLRKADPLDGRWDVVSMTVRGADATAMNPDVWVIRGGKVTRFSKGRDGTLYPLAPQFAYALERGQEAGHVDYVFGVGSAEAMRFAGLFTLDGDTLTLAHGINVDSPRPSDLKPGRGVTVFQFKRMPDEPKK